MSIIQARSIGKVARQILERGRTGTVMGVSSRGVFLNLDSGWTVFLSIEPYRGPLTLNLADRGAARDGLKPGDPAFIGPERVEFPAQGIEMIFAGAEVWEAPDIRISQGKRSQKHEGADAPLNRVLSIKNLATFASLRFKKSLQGLLPLLLDEISAQDSLLVVSARPLYRRLQGALESGQAAAAAEALAGFLGLGAGLTPSGDDLAAGFLLAANRWGGRLSPGLDLEALNAAVIASAQRQTTTLSASLIRCACRGQADERLVLALDGLASRAPDLEACAAALASWGNTSGFDALVGMALAMG